MSVGKCSNRCGTMLGEYHSAGWCLPYTGISCALSNREMSHPPSLTIPHPCERLWCCAHFWAIIKSQGLHGCDKDYELARADVQAGHTSAVKTPATGCSSISATLDGLVSPVTRNADTR